MLPQQLLIRPANSLKRIRPGPVNVLPQLLRSLRPLHSPLTQRCIRLRHRVSEGIHRNPSPIFPKHRLKHPAMAVKVGKLRVLKLAVQAA